MSNKMLGRSLLVGLLSLSSATNAWELGEGLYVGASAGGVKTGELPAAFRGGVESYVFHTGHHVKAAIGQRFNNFRIEVEPSIHKFKHKNAIPSNGQHIDMGKIKSINVLGNVYYDLPTDYDINPYLGAGLGFASIKMGGKNHPLASNTKLAYQVMAGLSLCVDENVSTHLEYRHAWTDKFNMMSKDLAKVTYPTKNFKHRSVNVGLTYRF